MGGLASCLAFNAFECALCAGCSCVSSLLNFSFSKATRVGHLLIVLLTFTLAIILGTHFPTEIFKYESELGVKDLVEGCSSYFELFDPNCSYEMYVQLIYRASFALSTFFSLLAIISYFFEAVDKSMWLVKFGMAIGTFIGFCYFKYDVIYQWAEAARYISLLWLAVQGLLYLDFAHDIHDVFMAHAEDSMRERGSASGTYGFYIFLSLGLLVCCGVGLVMLFISSSSRTDITFAVITLVTGLLLTGISLLNTVKKGLLTPCLVFFYSAFLNSYASSFALGSTSVKTLVASIAAIMSLFVLLYSIIKGTAILNVFDPQSEGLLMGYTEASPDLKTTLSGREEEAASPSSSPGSNQRRDDNSCSSGSERSFFHIVLVLFSSFAAMVLTNWHHTGPTYDGSQTSMWMLIIGQWTFLLLYFRMLYVAYINERDE